MKVDPAQAPGQNIIRGPLVGSPGLSNIYNKIKLNISFLGVIHALQALASTGINFNTVVHAKFPTKQCQNGTLAITIRALSKVNFSNVLI